MKSALIKIPSEISKLIGNHQKDLEEAWANCGEEPLSISFPVKIGFDKHSKPTCEIGINFVKEKVKDSITFHWDDKQIDLPLARAVRDLCPSVEISSGGESVTLTPETREKFNRKIKNAQ